MADVLLAARGVSVRFGGLIAVDGVDLEVSERELIGIIGPNGAGKTTLFHTLSGLVRPTAGRLSVRGRDLTGRPPHVFAAHGVARTTAATATAAVATLSTVRYTVAASGVPVSTRPTVRK